MKVTSFGLSDIRACDLGAATVVVDYGTGAVRVISSEAGRQAAMAGTPAVSGHRWEASWGVQELPMGFSEFPRVPGPYRWAAVAALLLVLAVSWGGRRRFRMRRMLRLMEFASRLHRRPADTHQAEKAVHAVRALGLFSPVRVACLEESVAAVLALAIRGRGVRWCHGVIADPIRLHAWIEVEGRPVEEPDSTRRCTALLTIPSMKEST
ncbi:hypothetical protein NOSIN_23665 [Nocardiopsis sinuspersici]|uniref:Microcin J25-processing protein McjB C-terminal domain-containing protein n=3 Tax=Nocardiopsidaceae TaxID=83676 RepID=A0A1V3C6Q9_9ACTN|nr:hypothetical protein NOSIN_23665 [Nocardiopsis sinuspersici]